MLIQVFFFANKAITVCLKDNDCEDKYFEDDHVSKRRKRQWLLKRQMTSQKNEFENENAQIYHSLKKPRHFKTNTVTVVTKRFSA